MMMRKFKMTVTGDRATASYLVCYTENERPSMVKTSGDAASFVRKDRSMIGFNEVHMDKLAESLKEQSEECGAEGVIEEVTGKREFQIRLEGLKFNADFSVTYHPGNAIPVVTSSGRNPDIPMPDGTTIPFSKLSPEDLQSFVESMAKTNGLNFEFVDIYD